MSTDVGVGDSIVLVGLTALQKYNAKGGEVVELCADGKVKVRLLDEGSLIKVNKRNCRKVLKERERDRSLSLSPSVGGGDIRSPDRSPIVAYPVQHPPVALTDEGEDFKEFSRLMSEVTSREKAFNAHCSQMQGDFARKQLIMQASSSRENTELSERNSELQLEVQQLKARLRAKDSNESVAHTVQRRVEEEVAKRLQTSIDAERRRTEREIEHRCQLKLDEERIKFEDVKKEEWRLLQESFQTQVTRLQAACEKKAEDERAVLATRHAEHITEVRLQAEQRMEQKIERLRGEFESLFKTKMAAVDDRAASIRVMHEGQLEVEKQKLAADRQREVELLRSQEEQRLAEVQYESAQLLMQIHEKQAEIDRKEGEHVAIHTTHGEEIRNLKTMHEMEIASTKHRIDMLQQDLAACRTENTLLKVKLQEQEVAHTDIMMQAHTMTTPVKGRREGGDMEGLHRDYKKLREDDEKEHERALRDQDMRHRAYAQSLQRQFEDKVAGLRSERDSVVAENKMLTVSVNMMHGTTPSRVPDPPEPPRDLTPPPSPSLGIVPDPAPSITTEEPVTVYASMGYKGESQTLFKGIYDIHNLPFSPILSINLPHGTVARFHQDLSGAGPARTVHSSCMCLTDFNANGASVVIA